MPHGAIPYPFGDCRICNDKATGVHYGVATCEGCKGFYKRSIPKGDKYRCYFGGKCVISPENRNRCKACRFRRCLEQGMAVEAVKMGRIPKVEKERALEQAAAKNQEDGACNGQGSPRSGSHSPQEIRWACKRSNEDGPSEMGMAGLSAGHQGMGGTHGEPDPKKLAVEHRNGLQVGFMLKENNASLNFHNHQQGLQHLPSHGPPSQLPPQAHHNHTVPSADRPLPSHIHVASYNGEQMARVNRDPCLYDSRRKVADGIIANSCGGWPCVTTASGNNSMSLKTNHLLDTSGTSPGSSQEHSSGSSSPDNLSLASQTRNGFTLLGSPEGVTVKMEEESNCQFTQPLRNSSPQGSGAQRSAYSPGLIKVLFNQVLQSEDIDQRDKVLKKLARSCSQEGLGNGLELLHTVVTLDSAVGSAVHTPCGQSSAMHSPSASNSGFSDSSASISSGTLATFSSEVPTVTTFTHSASFAAHPSSFTPVTSGQDTPVVAAEAILSQPGSQTIAVPISTSAHSGFPNMSPYSQSHSQVSCQPSLPPGEHSRESAAPKYYLELHPDTLATAPSDSKFVQPVNPSPTEQLNTFISTTSRSTPEFTDFQSPRPPSCQGSDTTSLSGPSGKDILDLNGLFRDENLRDKEDVSSFVSSASSCENIAGRNTVGDETDIELNETVQVLENSIFTKFGLVHKLKKRDYYLQQKRKTGTLALPSQKREEVWTELMKCVQANNESIIGFCRSVPGFSELDTADQEVLLKRAYYDIWMLTQSQFFIDGESFLEMENGLFYTRDLMESVIGVETTRTLHMFAQQFNALSLSQVEVAVLCCIQLTAPGHDQPDLKNPEEIQKLNSFYLDLLVSVVTQNHPATCSRVLVDIFRLIPLLADINRLQREIIANFSVAQPNHLNEEQATAQESQMRVADGPTA